MSERYRVRITKDFLVFSAGHFITYGNICERLHGHNWRLAAEVAGPLDADHLVVDFIVLRDTLKAIVDELDHRMLLPTLHPAIRVAAGPREVEVTYEDRRWVFPRGDCVLLEIENTTSELLARHIARRLAARLQTRGAVPNRIRIELDECFGNVAIYDWKNAAPL